MFLPLFPLELVVLPGQHLPLHIFEPRYKQLLNECRHEGITFGIPAAIEGRLAEYGTEMKLVEVFKEYESGEMDVLTRGIGAFRLVKYLRDVADKLYSGAEVESIENDPACSRELRYKAIERFVALHKVLDHKAETPEENAENLSFVIGHYVGFSLTQKVQLLSITREEERLEFIIAHIERTLPQVEQAAKLQKKIGGNGHMKDFPRG